MKKENYSWRDDPKNKEEVERHSWWNHPQNKETFPLPISIVNDNRIWVATFNDETEKYLGKKLNACGQGDSKEEAIKQLFEMIQVMYDFQEECRLSYQRFVPFRHGDWKHIGGSWFVIFGINIHFRYGRAMQGGWYMPLTKLNISVHNEWSTYQRWKLSKATLLLS